MILSITFSISSLLQEMHRRSVNIKVKKFNSLSIVYKFILANDEKKYECEPMPSSGNMAYEILLNEGILKKVVIQKVKE